MSGKHAKKGKKVDVAKNKAGVEIAVGDIVLVHPSRKTELPYIAKLKEIEEIPGKDDYYLRCTWYYRPKETYCGPQPWHGSAELFLSDHDDSIYMSNILRVVAVHSLEHYCCLAARDEQTDFYSRLQYKVSEKRFEPLALPIFCQCGQPLNPDLPMVCCGTCSEWYHVACISSMGHEQLAGLASFTCPHCKAKK